MQQSALARKIIDIPYSRYSATTKESRTSFLNSKCDCINLSISTESSTFGASIGPPPVTSPFQDGCQKKMCTYKHLLSIAVYYLKFCVHEIDIIDIFVISHDSLVA